MTPDRLLAMVLIASLVLHGCGDRQEDDDDDDETDDTADTGGTENDTDDTDSDTDDTDDTDGTDADTDDTDADTSGTDGTEPSDVDADGWTAAEEIRRLRCCGVPRRFRNLRWNDRPRLRWHGRRGLHEQQRRCHPIRGRGR